MADLRMEVEAKLKCPKCGGEPYRLYRRETAQGSGIFTNVLWPGPDGNVPPPLQPAELRCPNDGERLVRE